MKSLIFYHLLYIFIKYNINTVNKLIFIIIVFIILICFFGIIYSIALLHGHLGTLNLELFYVFCIFILISLRIFSITPYLEWIETQGFSLFFIIVSYFFFLGIWGLKFVHSRLHSTQVAILKHLSLIDNKSLMFF